jgi:hypothetical protein
MTSKTKDKKGAAKPSGPNVLTIAQPDGKSRERLLAELGFSAAVSNADTARAFAKGLTGELHFNDSIAVMREKVAQVQRGDLSETEATLTAQAVTLDAIFNAMAKRAALNMGSHLNATESYMRMALKAQAQCRATLETLAEVKFPKAATFVRQQNVAYQQQVNNGGTAGDSATSTHTGARTEESQSQQNKLLEDRNDERTHLDTGATAAAGGSNPALETVGAVDRATKRGG